MYDTILNPYVTTYSFFLFVHLMSNSPLTSHYQSLRGFPSLHPTLNSIDQSFRRISSPKSSILTVIR